MSELYNQIINELELLYNKEAKIKLIEPHIVMCSTKYYETNTSELLDEEFDDLVSRLSELDPSNPIPNTVAFGYACGNKDFPHPYGPMIGIKNKITVLPDDKVNYGKSTYSGKFDGASIICYYKGGLFYQALTRGDKDGFACDVTKNVYDKVSKEIEGLEEGYTRCEAVVSYKNYDEYFIQEGYESIRNVASAIITAKERKPLLKYIDLVPLSVYNHNEKKIYFIGDKRMDNYDLSGFKHKPINIIQTSSEFSEMVINDELLNQLSKDYPQDGVVCYTEGDGIKALKFNTDYAITEIESIEWNTQSTGKIFPRINIKEAQMKDCKANFITGKSGEFVTSLRLGIGDEIEIVKSGSIIPNFSRFIKDNGNTSIPTCSYGCDVSYVEREKIVDSKGKERLGANYFCTNPECPSILYGIVDKLIRLQSPKGFATEMVNIFIEMIDIFTRYESMSNLIDSDANILERMCVVINLNINDVLVLLNSNTNHQKMMITKTLLKLFKKQMTIYDLVSVLSIDSFGETLSKELEQQLKGTKDVNQFLIDHETFTSDQVNNSRARSSWTKRHHLIKQLLEVFTIMLPEEQTKSGTNGTVCITGKLVSGLTKNEFNNEIEKRGYTQIDSVKKDLTLLICNKPDSSKAQKAEKFGVKVVTEQEFLDNY